MAPLHDPDFHPAYPRETWSDRVYFYPYVGPQFENGLVDDLRTLIIGESHYKDEQADRLGRMSTIHHFRYLSSERYWGRLQKLVTRTDSPSAASANEAWRHVAFSNFVQELVGNGLHKRPNSAQWKSGEMALRELVDKLCPDVVLVIGRQTWNYIPDAFGYYSQEPAISADHEARPIWQMRHSRGVARATWIYHPRSGRETAAASVKVFQTLLNRSRARFAPAS